MDPIPTILAGKTIDIHAPATEVFGANINMKGFYNEMHDVLVRHGFKDDITPGNHTKKGEHTDAKTINRTGDMFETQFITIDNGWAREIEIRWTAVLKLPTSSYATATFKLDIVNRSLQNKEILVGNSKKVLQKGSWEFRNKIIYQNTIVEDYLKKIPIMKNSPYLQELYLRNIYNKKIEEEILFVATKVKGLIYGVIYKHFRD